MSLSAPEPLNDRHDVSRFDSGLQSLDDWLKRRALTNQVNGATRTYVACDADRVVAYYALASGAISTGEATGRLRRNMPEPIPIVILARLAVDRQYQGMGLGRGLVRDGALRVLTAGEAIGVRGLIVHAISEEAKRFYEGLGLVASPLHPLTLMTTLADLRENL